MTNVIGFPIRPKTEMAGRLTTATAVWDASGTELRYLVDSLSPEAVIVELWTYDDSKQEPTRTARLSFHRVSMELGLERVLEALRNEVEVAEPETEDVDGEEDAPE